MEQYGACPNLLVENNPLRKGLFFIANTSIF